MAKLDWYVNRLRAMSLAEIVHRASEAHRKRAWRDDLRGWDAFHVGPGRLDTAPELARRLAATPEPALADRLARTREMARSGRYSFLGAEWPAATTEPGPGGLPPVPWLLDPVSGTLWPGRERYCFDVGHRHDHVRGDVKFVWEINRLQVLPALLVGAGEDPALTDGVWRLLAQWMEENPPFRGVNWNSGIELALRIVSLWLVVHARPQALDEARIAVARRFLAAHGFWLARYPSRHSSANNHLIAEGLGLFLAALMVPDLPDSNRWRSEGVAIIVEETARQFHPDGVGAEQSPTYTAFSAEMVALALLAARLHGVDMPASVPARLAEVASWLRFMMDRNGHVPRIGDDDEGRVVTAPPDREPRYVASVTAAVAGLLDRPDLAPPARDPALRDLVFLPPAAGSEAGGIRTFGSGGYTVVHEAIAGRAALLVFDHGPLGYLSIAAHGHADTLALWLHLDGEPVLVDAGTYLYHAGGAWRDAMRGTALHNTLTLGVDSSTISGPFMWAQKAAGRLRSADAVPGAWRFEAEHDGYAGRFGLTHVRRVAREGDAILVADSLAGADQPRRASIGFLLHPRLAVRREGDTVVASGDGGPVLAIDLPAGFETQIVQGDEERKLGFYSCAFGARAAAPQVVATGQIGSEPVISRLTVKARSF